MKPHVFDSLTPTELLRLKDKGAKGREFRILVLLDCSATGDWDISQAAMFEELGNHTLMCGVTPQW